MSYADRRVTPMWLAHHYPEDYGRCVRLGRSHICRRCIVLYPVAFVVMGIGLALGPATTNDNAGLALAMILLPVPAVVEFVLEHLGVIQYQPVRQMVVTFVLGIGLGLAFARYLRHPADLLFWAVAILYSGVCLAAALSGRRAPVESGDR